MTKSEFVGVDGFSCGWFSVGYSGRGYCEMKAFFSFEDLLAYYQTAKLILVDVPIGLPPAKLQSGSEERHCDKEARGRLNQLDRRRGSSVFRVPTRCATKHFAHNPDDKNGARNVEISRTGGISISEQALGIMCKIAEVDDIMLDRKPNARPEIREIHPEICFWALNDENSMEFSKTNKDADKRSKAIDERLEVLQKVEPKAKEIFNDGWSRFRHNCVGKDDILDAMVAAITAYKGSQGWLQKLPKNKPPQRDEESLRMEMVFWQPESIDVS